MEGTGAIAGQMRGQVALTVPEVAPFAKALGSAVHGRFGMTLVGAQVGEATQVTADGTLITIGAPIPLLGESAKFHAAGTLRGRTVALTDGRIDGSHVATTFDGTLAPGTTNLRGTVEIDDLTSLRPDLAGRLRIVASVDGPPDDLAIAMQPFRQIDAALSRRFDGTGLGLPLAKALIELHGGRLEIESTPGVGTTVVVLLPIERAMIAAA